MTRDYTKHFSIKGPMTLRQVTLQTGLTEDTLRYYEKIGLLPRIERDKSSKQRRYSVDNVYTAYKLAALRATGMSVKDMQDYIKNDVTTPELIGQQVELLNNQKNIVKAKMIRLEHQLEYLETKTAHYEAMSRGDEDEMYRLEIRMISLAKELNDKLKNLTDTKEAYAR
jgi:DNA-binding transcriptional MerR regulator